MEPTLPTKTSHSRTVLESVRHILTDWKAAFEVRNALPLYGHAFMSESAVTARIRDLRKTGLTVDCRKNGKHWEYKVAQCRKEGVYIARSPAMAAP